MLKEDKAEEMLLKVLRAVAPGTPLREGLEYILRAKSGALIVIAENPEVIEIAEGGFAINSDFTPAALHELAKMDGAIILNQDMKRILVANTQLVPNLSFSSSETGIRHKTAERVARQTDSLVIAISERRGVITVYKSTLKYMLRDLGVILTKANQAIQTLEKYRNVLNRVIVNLSTLEFEGEVTLYDVAKVIQRVEMVLRITKEIERYICELGVEGRLITMQLEELVADIDEESLLLIRDYVISGDKSPEAILKIIGSWSAEDLLDLSLIARALGYSGSTGILEQNIQPRGYRVLDKIPRLPFPVIENLVQTFDSMDRILRATIEELDEVEGIGEARARSIKEGLAYYREQLNQERYGQKI